ncbi:unnamed protein product [Mycena citricolor]|uniref:Vacuolar protein sorting-associated protein 9a n=1 Tax=Mycena citricolor TaxID=2018698 RepID=A0AAD2HYZ1_9AGAR|nr:unnamed protein product [Mycena citricolor]
MNHSSSDTTIHSKEEVSAPAPVVAPSPDPNPWETGVHKPATGTREETTPVERPPLTTPDYTQLDESFQGFEAESPVGDTNPAVSEQVLSEFDPLADQHEVAAREAWENSESHPPPPRTPSPPPPPPREPTQPETPTTGASQSPSTSVFSPFSALARSLNPLNPIRSRSRPGSMDIARPVPSPSTLSAFVEQQTQPPKPAPAIETTTIVTTSTSTSRSSTPAASSSSTDPPPFDFQKFLDQMKSRHAEIVAKYLKSFLGNFAKRTFTVNDQIKIINDFLNVRLYLIQLDSYFVRLKHMQFIAKPMRESELWKNASEAEFENAMEGMEKLVMNQLYQFTFTPEVAKVVPRRQITADDLERDRVLTQRIALFGWIKEEHLDIPTGEGSQGFMMFAEQELMKVNHYKAPRDKLICILNCCKVIFGLPFCYPIPLMSLIRCAGLIRHLKKDEGADSFVPILIFVVLKANPEHLLSNVEFINRFRNPTKLQSEAGYYLSSLMGAVSFIETMDHTSLSNITQEEFEANVEDAIAALPEPDSPAIRHAVPETVYRPSPASSVSHEGDESAEPLSIATPAQIISEDARRLLQKTGDTISKPLNALSRIFNEALDNAEGKLQYLPGPFAPFELGREQRQQQHQPNYYYDGHVPQTPAGDGFAPPIQTPYKPRVRRIPSSASGSMRGTPPGTPGPDDTPSRAQNALVPPRLQSLHSPGVSRTPTPNLDLVGMQAQIDSAHNQAAQAAKDTLVQIFPGVDQEVIQWVLEANQGDLGKSIEALLEMSSGD